jgi:acetyl-CoA carboxylase alpha subunit
MIKAALNVAMKQLCAVPTDQLLERRYEKFRRIGVFEECPPAAAEAV